MTAGATASEAYRGFDSVVVGAGIVGLSLSIGLARAGFSVCLVGPMAPVRSGRTVALLGGSVDMLIAIAVWPQLEAACAPLRTMRLVDATGSLFRPPPVSFEAAEIGRPAFGYNIENAILERVLAETAQEMPGLTVISRPATGFAYRADEAIVSVDTGETIRARLVVAADGRNSLARRIARIGVRLDRHPQTALTALFDHDAPHREVSTEFHTRQGPFTLVPLPDGTDGTHRSSLVWVMSPSEAERRRKLDATEFAIEAERQCVRLLGRMTLASPVGTFPLATSISRRVTGLRLVLTGEAAHALPPIGAQGLNLSFRDVASLLEHLETARDRRQDIGSPDVLDRYAAARAGDVASRAAGVGLLNASLLTHSLAADLMRGMGLAALGAVGPLRRLAMRQGLVAGGRAVTTQA